MFRWFSREPALPALSHANPGRGTWIKTAFANGERSWEETADALMELATVIEPRGLKFQRGKSHLELVSGLILRPQFVHLQPRDDGSVQTTCTIEVNHPTLCPAGLFEYQHAIGPTTRESMRKGFAGWADSDLPVFQDALREKPQDCTAMSFEPKEGESFIPGRREVLFGPTVHLAAREVSESGQGHDFCPCCLFTNSLTAFREHLQANEFRGIRLYASRDVNGEAVADCRINGVDWAPGQAELLKYVATWPDRGFEYRKQYVAICLPPKG